MSMIKKYGPYGIFILTAIVFAGAGIGKLAGTPMLHESFSLMGLPALFGYFIGASELAGAIGLLLPFTRRLAASGLAIIMLGAIYFHIAYSVPSPVPGLILLALLIFAIWWKPRPVLD